MQKLQHKKNFAWEPVEVYAVIPGFFGVCRWLPAELGGQ